MPSERSQEGRFYHQLERVAASLCTKRKWRPYGKCKEEGWTQKHKKKSINTLVLANEEQIVHGWTPHINSKETQIVERLEDIHSNPIVV